MIQIEKLTYNPFQENTYLLYDETNECVIVDPGCLDPQEQQHLASVIAQKNLTPVKLIFTHLHLDHVFGANFVAKTWDIPIMAHKADEFFIGITKEYCLKFGISINENPPNLTGYINDNDTITFGKSELKVIHTTGHSPGGICFYSETDKLLVAGDVLFYGSIGRTDLAMGDYDTLIESITNRLLILPDDVVVYSGHGPQTSIGFERNNNGYLR